MATLLRVTLSELAAMTTALLRQSSIKIEAVNKTVIHIELVPKRDISSLPEVDLPFDTLEGELKVGTLWVVKTDASNGVLTVGIEDAAPAAAPPARPQAQQPTAPATTAQPIRVRPVPAPAPIALPVLPATTAQPQAPPPTPAVAPQPPATAVVAPTVPVPAPAPAPASVVQPTAPAAAPTPQRGNWLQRGITWITGG